MAQSCCRGRIRGGARILGQNSRCCCLQAQLNRTADRPKPSPEVGSNSGTLAAATRSAHRVIAPTVRVTSGAVGEHLADRGSAGSGFAGCALDGRTALELLSVAMPGNRVWSMRGLALQ